MLVKFRKEMQAKPDSYMTILPTKAKLQNYNVLYIILED